MTNEEILRIARPVLTYPDSLHPTLRGTDDIVAFARAVLAAEPLTREAVQPITDPDQWPPRPSSPLTAADFEPSTPPGAPDQPAGVRHPVITPCSLLGRIRLALLRNFWRFA